MTEELPAFQVFRLPVAVLAYIGDAVFELHVRQAALRQLLGGQAEGGVPASWAPGAVRVGALHRRASVRARAHSQARALQRLRPLLDETERELVRRARNSPVRHRPRGARPLEYRISTALEALVGYLYLSGRTGRLSRLLEVVAGDEAAQGVGTEPVDAGRSG